MMKNIVMVLMLVFCATVSSAEVPEARNTITLWIEGTPIVLLKISPSNYGLDYPDYFVSETEVTNDQYKKYLNRTGRTKDDTEVLKIINERKMSGISSTGEIPYSIEDETTIWRNDEYPKGLNNHPVALVTLKDAVDFCDWLSRQNSDQGLIRLPTWNEWMIAAYGKARRYPWGKAWQKDRVHTSFGFEYPDFPKRTEPVKNRPNGRTPEGLYGMLGNVSEFLGNGDPANQGYFNLGSRWMGGGFTTGTFAKPNASIQPRQKYWGYSHHSTLQECDLGFRIVLDPQKNKSLLKRPPIFE